MAERCVTAGDGITSEAVNVILSCEDADRIVDALCIAAASSRAISLEDLARDLMSAIRAVRAGSRSLLSGE
jgi:hypothetical protein